LNARFWELFFEGNYQPGKCLCTLKERYVWEVIYFDPPYIQMAVANLVGYNLLGDPELSIWTDEPGELVVKQKLYLDNNAYLDFKVTDPSGSPVDGARICVYNGQAYAYGTTNSTGKVLIDLDPRLLGTLEITTTAHNFLPHYSNYTFKNIPPTIDDLPDVILDEDEELLDAIFVHDYISDPDNTRSELQVLILNITDTNAGVLLGKNNSIIVYPASNWYGEAIVTLDVSDLHSSVEGTLKVIIRPINDPPKIISSVPNSKIKVGERFNFQVQASDIEDDTLSFSDDSELFDIDPDTGQIDYKASERDVGKHNITITVSDGNHSTDQTFILEIYDDDVEPSFLELYWFPIIVLVITIIIIVSVLIVYFRSQKSEGAQASPRDQKIARKKKASQVKTKPKPKSKPKKKSIKQN
jgi:hypothetical protein